MIRAFCAWLAATPLSVMLGTTRWIVPAVQTIHILAIAIAHQSRRIRTAPARAAPLADTGGSCNSAFFHRMR